MKSALPFSASPGFSISGVSAAITSLLALPAGLRVLSRAFACCATCRFGCERNRATLPGPRPAGVIFPSFIAARSASVASGRLKI